MSLPHLATIKALLETLLKSDTFHALVIQSPPGWAKSTTIDRALKELGRPFVAVGAYATPLHIYNTLSENPSGTIVLDDCAGLFSDPKSMSILKAATWQSTGFASHADATLPSRRIAWGSTSDKVVTPAFDFSGKIILLTNVVNAGKETEAFLSRCLSYPIAMSTAEIRAMLHEAAKSISHFPNTPLAQEVASFICAKETQADLARTNLRTLKLGYDLAVTHPGNWKQLFSLMLPKQQDPTAINEIFLPGLTTQDQLARFQAATGKSRRAFYYEKKKLGLSRGYANRS